MKKRTKEEKIVIKKEKEDNQQAESLYIDKILPIIDFDDELGIAIMEDGTFCDCFSIVCKDLNSITADQLAMDVLTWEKVYKTYAGDLKIVSFSFPTDTREQQEYIEYKLAETQNPILREFLHRRQGELEYVNREYLMRESALFFFARTPAEYKNNFTALRALLSSSITPLIKPMPVEKKKKLLFKMCNKNLNH